MAIEDDILSIVVSEESAIASIISAEAAKASQTAFWLTQIPIASISIQPISTVVQEVTGVQNSISCVLRSAADKEVAIAAKVNAIKGVRTNICWAQAACPQQAIISASTSPVTPSCSTTGNLISNGDFETSPPPLASWTTFGTTPPTLDTDPFQGTFDAEISRSSPASPGLDQTVSIPGACAMSLSFAARGNNASKVLNVTVTYDTGAPFTTSIPLTSTYQVYSFAFKPPTGATSATVTFSRDVDGTGFIHLDSVDFHVI